MTQKREHSVGDEIDRGLMPGDEQKDGGRDEIIFAHASGRASSLRRQSGEQIVLWTLALGFDDNAEIIRNRLIGLEVLEELRFVETEIGSSPRASVFDQPSNFASSSAGTPRSSQIMATGKG